jgi:alpha-D-ribose 1-methylphosphonate 5-triphosphate synthase subunit PhnH
MTMLAGLADPTLDSQRIFRSLLEAMAHPGRIVDVAVELQAPSPLHPAAAAACLTMLDFDTPLWLDEAAARPDAVEWLRFHSGAPIVSRPQAARFALIADPQGMPSPDTFDSGTAEYPERSATLIVQVQSLLGGTGRRLRGPGIADEARLEVAGLPDAFWTWMAANHALFPCGVDVVLSAGRVIAALPRTTKVEG